MQRAGRVPTSGIEVANASSLQALEQDVLSVVQAGGAGGLLIGNGGTGLGLPAGIGGVSAGMAAMLPLGSAAMSVEARSQAFAECHRGARTWRDVLRTGDITVSGRPALGRAFPTWNLHAPVVDPKFSRMAG
jgi:hypothetical protein